MLYRIIAFDKNWKYKGMVDPSIRDNVDWIRIEDAISFIENNKPESEYWLIKLIKSHSD